MSNYKVGDKVKAVGIGDGEESDIADRNHIGKLGTVDLHSNRYDWGTDTLIVVWDKFGFDWIDTYKLEKLTQTEKRTMINAIEVNDGIVVLLDGRPTKIDSNDYRFTAVKNAVYDQDQEALELALESSELETVFSEVSFEGLTVNEEGVFFLGHQLHGSLVDKIMSLVREGYPVDRFVKFYNNLLKNPSRAAIDELYDFMAVKELPITDDGRLVAYKGVMSSGFSAHGNPDTVVLQGVVNSSGQIRNDVGDVIEVLRADVDDDRSRGCSTGLHVGSWDYASRWARGLVLIVAVNPADVVSVPSEDHSKMRVSKYEVLDTTEVEIESSVYGEENESYLTLENREGWTMDEYITNALTDDEYSIDDVQLDDLEFEFNLSTEDDRFPLISELARNGYRVLRDGRVVFDD